MSADGVPGQHGLVLHEWVRRAHNPKSQILNPQSQIADPELRIED